jgi:hypothetical protein
MRWGWLIGGGALAALLLRGMLGKRKPELVITSWKESQLPSGWAPAAKAAGFDAVSKKIVHTDSAFRPNEAGRVFAAADAAGLARMGWGWHHIRNPEEAIAEGQAAAAIAKSLGVGTYMVNAEKMWAGVEGEPATPNPPRELSTFVDAFRSVAPGVRLYFNGFSWTKTSDGRPLLTAEVLRKFDGFAPMNYGTSPKTIAKKFRSRRARARELGIDYAPMVGTGRVSNTGQVWGFANPTGGHPGLLELIAEDPPELVAFWYGAGSKDMLMQGSQANPSLINVAKAVRSDSSVA